MRLMHNFVKAWWYHVSLCFKIFKVKNKVAWSIEHADSFVILVLSIAIVFLIFVAAGKEAGTYAIPTRRSYGF